MRYMQSSGCITGRIIRRLTLPAVCARKPESISIQSATRAAWLGADDRAPGHCAAMTSLHKPREAHQRDDWSLFLRSPVVLTGCNPSMEERI